MADFSFKRYMDHAVQAERMATGDSPPPVQLIPRHNQHDVSTLVSEARIVADALVEIFFNIRDNSLYRLVENVEFNPEDDESDILGGWDIDSFLPYDPSGASHKARDSILLGDNGRLYHYRFQVLSRSEKRAVIGKPSMATKGLYIPEASSQEDNERVRYGLARLIARYELEIPEAQP